MLLLGIKDIYFTSVHMKFFLGMLVIHLLSYDVHRNPAVIVVLLLFIHILELACCHIVGMHPYGIPEWQGLIILNSNIIITCNYICKLLWSTLISGIVTNHHFAWAHHIDVLLAKCNQRCYTADKKNYSGRQYTDGSQACCIVLHTIHQICNTNEVLGLIIALLIVLNCLQDSDGTSGKKFIGSNDNKHNCHKHDADGIDGALAGKCQEVSSAYTDESGDYSKPLYLWLLLAHLVAAKKFYRLAQANG